MSTPQLRPFDHHFVLLLVRHKLIFYTQSTMGFCVCVFYYYTIKVLSRFDIGYLLHSLRPINLKLKGSYHYHCIRSKQNVLLVVVVLVLVVRSVTYSSNILIHCL